MGLLDSIRPKWKNSDADVRIAAAKEIRDPAVLVKMIVNDAEWFVRHNAFAALRDLEPDQSFYNQVVREAKDEEVRRKAVKVMTNESDLEWVAKNDKFRYVRDAAEHRLNELRNNIWNENSDGAGAAPSAS
ncbi:MAG: hypothetical protein GC160_14110 [Acidobacteria bacterium]|nr:hypothetical protein [Acidobacteriota bacterium]